MRIEQGQIAKPFSGKEHMVGAKPGEEKEQKSRAQSQWKDREKAMTNYQDMLDRIGKGEEDGSSKV